MFCSENTPLLKVLPYQTGSINNCFISDAMPDIASLSLDEYVIVIP
jgi:hypothetical protein